MLQLVAAAVDAAPTQPKWTEVVGAINGSLTFIAVIVGAAVGYLRFLKSRKLHASCGLTMDSEVVSIGHGSGLRVSIRITNEGSYQLVFPQSCSQLFQISLATEEMACRALRDTGEINWRAYIFHQQDILEGDRPVRDNHLEPGQSFVRCFLIPLPDERAIGYRVHAQVQAHPRSLMRLKGAQTWSTETTITAEARDGRRSSSRERYAKVDTMGVSGLWAKDLRGISPRVPGRRNPNAVKSDEIRSPLER